MTDSYELFDQGLLHLERHEYDEGIAKFSQVIKAEKPTAGNTLCAYAHINRAIGYMLQHQKNQNEKALQDVNRAIEIDLASDPNAYTLRGLIFVEQGKFDEAHDEFTQAILNDSANETAYFHRGQLHMRRGQEEEAMHDYTYANIEGYTEGDDAMLDAQNIKHHPIQFLRKIPPTMRRKSDASDNNNNNNSITTTTTTDSSGGKDANRDNNNNNNDNNGNSDNSNNNNGNNDASGNTNPKVTLNQCMESGNASLEAGDYDKAISEFTTVINIDPDHPTVFEKLAKAYAAKSMTTKTTAAAATITAAAVRNNNNNNSSNIKKNKKSDDDGDSEYDFILKGLRFLKEQGSLSGAVLCFSRAIALSPNRSNAASYFLRGYCWLMRGLAHKALEDLNRSIALNNRNALALFLRGCILAEDCKLNSALEDFSATIDLVAGGINNNLHALARFNRAAIYAFIRQVYRSLDDYTEAIAQFPRLFMHPTALKNINFVIDKTQDWSFVISVCRPMSEDLAETIKISKPIIHKGPNGDVLNGNMLDPGLAPAPAPAPGAANQTQQQQQQQQQQPKRMHVAIRELETDDSGGGEHVAALQKEIIYWSAVCKQSPYFIDFYGWRLFHETRHKKQVLVCWLLMAKADCNLTKYLEANFTKIKFHTKVAIALQAALGLLHLHRQGIAFRNFKPSNILMFEKQEALVPAHQLGSSATITTTTTTTTETLTLRPKAKLIDFDVTSKASASDAEEKGGGGGGGAAETIPSPSSTKSSSSSSTTTTSTSASSSEGSGEAEALKGNSGGPKPKPDVITPESFFNKHKDKPKVSEETREAILKNLREFGDLLYMLYAETEEMPTINRRATGIFQALQLGPDFVDPDDDIRKRNADALARVREESTSRRPSDNKHRANNRRGRRSEIIRDGTVFLGDCPQWYRSLAVSCWNAYNDDDIDAFSIAQAVQVLAAHYKDAVERDAQRDALLAAATRAATSNNYNDNDNDNDEYNDSCEDYGGGALVAPGPSLSAAPKFPKDERLMRLRLVSGVNLLQAFALTHSRTKTCNLYTVIRISAISGSSASSSSSSDGVASYAINELKSIAAKTSSHSRTTTTSTAAGIPSYSGCSAIKELKSSIKQSVPIAAAEVRWDEAMTVTVPNPTLPVVGTSSKYATFKPKRNPRMSLLFASRSQSAEFDLNDIDLTEEITILIELELWNRANNLFRTKTLVSSASARVVSSMLPDLSCNDAPMPLALRMHKASGGISNSNSNNNNNNKNGDDGGTMQIELLALNGWGGARKKKATQDAANNNKRMSRRRSRSFSSAIPALGSFV